MMAGRRFRSLTRESRVSPCFFDNSGLGRVEFERFRREERWGQRELSWPSAVRAHGGCLGAGRRGRTWQAAISQGEPHAGCDPWMSEWGNPAGVVTRHPCEGRPTRGTETSQYLEEKKSSEIP
jgi:hypothetical protein